MRNEVARLREENAALKEALRQHELRLQTLIESLPFDFWMMNEAGRSASSRVGSPTIS